MSSEEEVMEQEVSLPPLAHAEAVLSSPQIPIAAVVEILPNETIELPVIAVKESKEGENSGTKNEDTNFELDAKQNGGDSDEKADQKIDEDKGEEESILSPEAERQLRSEDYAYLLKMIEDASDDPVALAEAQEAFDNFEYDENGDPLPEETDDENENDEKRGDDLSGSVKGTNRVQKDVANLYIRPEDLDGWRMSKDEPVELEWSMTIINFFDWISSHRPHIPAGRITVEYNGKQIPSNKYNWDIRRLGIRDGSILRVQPTILRAWAWHTIDQYEDLFLREMAEHIIVAQDGRLNLEDVPKLVPIPPVLGEIKHFIRKHPEKIFLRCDVSSGKTWACINEGWQLPSFERLPVEMGHIKEYKPFAFDWDSYADANSQKPIIQELNIPGRSLEVNVISCHAVHRNDDVFAPVNISVGVYWDREYDPEYEGTKFNRFKRGIINAGETKKKLASSNPVWATWHSRFLLQMDVDDDIELCQLALQIFDHSKREDDEGDKHPIGVARIDSDDLAMFVGQPKCVTTRLPIMEGKRHLGDITILSTKGTGSYEFKVNCAREIRTDTPLSTNSSKMYAKVRWNGDEIHKTGFTFGNQDPIWTMGDHASICVNSHPYESISQCDLEVQLWVTESDKDGAPEYFLGALKMEGEKLEKFLCGDPFHIHHISEKLSRSVHVPKEDRDNVIQGYMTLVGGRSGFLPPFEGYHPADVKLTEGKEKKKRRKKKDKEKSLEKNRASENAAEEAAAKADVEDPNFEGIDYTEEELAKFAEERALAEAKMEEEQQKAFLSAEKERLQKEEAVREIKMRTKMKYYSVQVLGVTNLQNVDGAGLVIATAWMGSKNLGVSTPLKVYENLEANYKCHLGNWNRDDESNIFEFSFRIPHKDDLTHEVDVVEETLKVSLFNFNNGVWRRFLGCIQFTGKDLYKFLNEDGFADVKTTKLEKDKSRPGAVAGELRYRHGPKGARLDNERIIAVEGCASVVVKKIDTREKKLYCILYYNKIEIGRTKPKYSDFVLRQKELKSGVEENKSSVVEIGDNETALNEQDGNSVEDEEAIKEAKQSMRQKLHGRAAVLLHRVLDVYYGSENMDSTIYFERIQPKVPLREGNLLEIELVVEVPKPKRQETTMTRMSMVSSSIANATVDGQNGTKNAQKGIEQEQEEETMLIGLGTASMQGLVLDNWLQSKEPSVQELEMTPSGRFPRDFSGIVHGRVSMLTQLTTGFQAPPEVVGKLKIHTPGINIRSPFKLQEYLVAKDKAAQESAAKEAKKAKERAEAKAKKRAEKEEKKKQQEEERKQFNANANTDTNTNTAP